MTWGDDIIRYAAEQILRSTEQGIVSLLDDRAEDIREELGQAINEVVDAMEAGLKHEEHDEQVYEEKRVLMEQALRPVRGFHRTITLKPAVDRVIIETSDPDTLKKLSLGTRQLPRINPVAVIERALKRHGKERGLKFRVTRL